MATLDPTAITVAPGQAPFTTVPIIQDMLDSRQCPSEAIFIVEGIEALLVGEKVPGKVLRLLLGDGQLCIQALLIFPHHEHLEHDDIFVGCYIRADELEINIETLPAGTNGQEQDTQMAYLILHKFTAVGLNETYIAWWKDQQTNFSEALPAVNLELDDIDGDVINDAATPNARAQKSSPLKKKFFDSQETDMDDMDMENAFEAYDAIAFPPSRKTPKKTPKKPAKTLTSAEATSALLTSDSQSVAMAQNWHDPRTPLKLTILRSIPHLPYAQNWSVNVLAIIVSLSPVEASYLPPHKQRTARIADPSTTKHVHLTVFLDPEAFNPAVGSAVLLTGVKNHRFDGGCLKKYASDRGQGQWWFEDPWEMAWCNVAGIKEWWAEVQTAETEGQ